MGRKRVVVLSFAVLALLAGLAVYLVMTGDSPDPEPEPRAADTGDVRDDPPAPLELRPDDFEASRVQPDPVTDETPSQTFDTSPDALRLIVSGRVTGADGAGIKDARVTFVGEHKLRDLRGHGYTDHAGQYRLLAWAPKPGGTAAADPYGRVYAETPDGGLGVGESIPIDEEFEFRMPDVQIAAGGAIEGTVLTATGDPVPGAQVTARSSGAVQVISTRGRGPATLRRQLVRSVFADAAGQFRLGNLPPAEYQLTVHGGYHGLESGSNIVNLNGGGTQWYDLRVKPAGYIRGTLKDQYGQPVENAVVRLRREDTSQDNDSELRERISIRRRDDQPRSFRESRDLERARHQVTDAKGQFGFHRVPAGDWNVVCKLGDSEIIREGVGLDSDLELEVEVRTFVGGIVRDAGSGRVVENYNVRILKGAGETTVSPFQRVAREGQFQFHPAGQYAFANPAPGEARIRVSAPGYAPAVVNVGDIRQGDQRRDMDVELRPLCELSLALKHDGRGLDLEPVALLFDDRLAFAASTDELGTARIPDVAPAEYRVKVVRADGRVLEGELTVPAQSAAILTLELTPES